MYSQGLHQAAFARNVGFGVTTINQYCTGTNRPEIDIAIQIAERTSTSLDWIYRQKADGLPPSMQASLQKALRELPDDKPFARIPE